jgi:hypothetical protein
LAQLLLVIADPVFLQQRDEIIRRVTRQRRFAEVWIFGNEVFGAGVQIRKVAAPTSGDGNLLTNPF